MTTERERYYPGPPVDGLDGEDIARYVHEEFLKIADYFRNFHSFTVVRTAVDYTPRAWDLVLCTAAVTITLNTGAEEEDEVYVIRTNGLVTLSGSINGATTTYLMTNGDSMHLKYFENETDWKYK